MRRVTRAHNGGPYAALTLLLLFVLGLPLGAVALPASPAAAAGTSVGLQPNSLTVRPGQNFTLDVAIDTDANIRDITFGLAFDSRVMRLDGVGLGDFLPAGASAMRAEVRLGAISAVTDRANIVPPSDLNGVNASGVLSPLTLTVLPGSASPVGAGPSGRGVVASVRMTARSGSTRPTEVRLTGVQARATAGAGRPGVQAVGGIQVGNAALTVPIPSAEEQRAAAATAATRLAFTPDTRTVAPGEEFSLDVTLSTNVQNRATQFGVKFDRSVVEVLSVTPGEYYRRWAGANGAQANQVGLAPNNETGVVSPGGISILGGPPRGGPTGSDVVVSLRLRAREGINGRSVLELSDVLIADGDAAPIVDVGVVFGEVVVAGSGAPQPPVQPAPEAPPPPPAPVSAPAPEQIAPVAPPPPPPAIPTSPPVVLPPQGGQQLAPAPVVTDPVPVAPATANPAPVVIVPSEGAAPAPPAGAAPSQPTSVPSQPTSAPTAPAAGAQGQGAAPTAGAAGAQAAGGAQQAPGRPRLARRPRSSTGIVLPGGGLIRWEIVGALGGALVAAGAVAYALRQDG